MKSILSILQPEHQSVVCVDQIKSFGLLQREKSESQTMICLLLMLLK